MNKNDEKFIELCMENKEDLLFCFQEKVFKTRGGKAILNFKQGSKKDDCLEVIEKHTSQSKTCTRKH